VDLGGRSVVHWALLAFVELLERAELDGVLVVLSPGDEDFDAAVPADLRARLQAKPVGGATRAASVRAGLQDLSHQGLVSDDWVLVHDAARCLVSPADLEGLIQACEHDPVGGLLAHPVPDTLKRSNELGRVQCTVAREQMWAAQTPQMFRLGPLSRALDRAMAAGAALTDEASALEWAGLQPRLVQGSADNFKVTYPEDFQRAWALLQQRSVLG
jgi:2-C-methyl-D-erythritol 4-phosphate cytidylyltransferase